MVQATTTPAAFAKAIKDETAVRADVLKRHKISAE